MSGGLWQRQVPTRPPLSAASPPRTATGTLSIEILEVNDHAPELSPPSGSLCSEPDQGSGLLLGATDEDRPPHGAPFHFLLSPRFPELARNWSLSQINSELQPQGCDPDLGGHSKHSPAGSHFSTPSGGGGRDQLLHLVSRWARGTAPHDLLGAWRGHGQPRRALLTSAPSTVSHARLRLRHQVREGLHLLSLLLRDSGQPPRQHEQPLNVTVCHCAQDGTCLQGTAALRARSTGISLGALAIVLTSVILLLRECPCPETLEPSDTPHIPALPTATPPYSHI